MSVSSAARLGLAIGSATLALSACSDTPVELPATYTPAAPVAGAQPGRAPPRDACRVRLAGIQDLRDSPGAGVFVERFVHAEEAPSWLRSGLLSLSRDARLDVSDQTPSDSATLTIRVDLLKVYMMPINTAESANVVIRVHYGNAAALVYRGTSTGLNWTGLDAEARGAFDDAMGRMLEQVHADLLARCAALAGRSAETR